MAVLFISSVVPDTKEFQNAAFTRSGNNVLLGITMSLAKMKNTTFVSLQPIPSFPYGRLFIPMRHVTLDREKTIIMLPTINLKLIKNFIWNIICFIYVLKWAFINRHEQRNILVYNIYLPSISSLFKVSKITKSKLFAILYDLGVPPKRLGLSRLTMWAYKIGEKKAKKYLPKISGRIVINENIATNYAPNEDYILVDGGINDQVKSHLFPLAKSTKSKFTFVLAGMLWDQNGTKLVLEMLKAYPDLDVSIVFAGRGMDVPLIEDASVNDSRIKYAGSLTLNELFKLYEEADVLLNLRIEEDVDFHFPSKLLEYMVTGRHVISTPIAHAERDYGEYITFVKDITPDGLYMAIKEVIARKKETLYKTGLRAREFMLKYKNWGYQTSRIYDYIKSKN